jgi:hypothetical protein
MARVEKTVLVDSRGRTALEAINEAVAKVSRETGGKFLHCNNVELIGPGVADVTMLFNVQPWMRYAAKPGQGAAG